MAQLITAPFGVVTASDQDGPVTLPKVRCPQPRLALHQPGLRDAENVRARPQP
jgi:hypothetical protein